MKNRLFSTDHPNGLVRQNSDINLDKDSTNNKQMRQMRQMKSVNKQLGSKKKHFFFQQGQKTVGDYKFDVRKQIGTGYSSKVYKAVSVKDNQIYAIKAIQFKNFKPSHFQMLENQIRILKKMSHPNVLKFQNVSKTSTHLYIVTEFCQKGDLLTYMTRKGVLHEKQALQIFSDILRGVQYLQKFGIIHRDIKPGNIISDGKVWKIADFGFAVESVEQIRTRNNVGTPLYMPLQSLQKNLYSPESDVFSVGVVLYELLIGITPWQCRDQQQLIRKLKNVEFRMPQRNKISPQIKQLLKKLCEPLRQNRMTKKQFLMLDPMGFKNFQSTGNIFKKDQALAEFEQLKKQMSPSPIKRKISIKNYASGIESNSKLMQTSLKIQQINSNTKIKQLNSTTKIQELNGSSKIQQLKQRNQIEPKKSEVVNLFANGKMKKSSQNIKTNIQHRSSLMGHLTKIKSATNLLLTSEFQENIETAMDLQAPKSTLNIRVDRDQMQKIQKINRNILLSLLNFCRFMYYLMKNSNHLELTETTRQKVKIILMKHAILLLRQLTDSQNNWFNLDSYQTYKESKNYFKIYGSFQEYLTKYQKEYEQIAKKVDSVIAKQVNQKIGEFNFNISQSHHNDQPIQSVSQISMSDSFYQKLIGFVAPILRQNNHNLASQIINNKKKIIDQTRFKIEGIKHFFKYYRLIEMLSKQSTNYWAFQQNNNIEVVKNYSESTATVEQFMILRKEMKYI